MRDHLVTLRCSDLGMRSLRVTAITLKVIVVSVCADTSAIPERGTVQGAPLGQTAPGSAQV